MSVYMHLMHKHIMNNDLHFSFPFPSFLVFLALPNIDISLPSTQVVILEGNDLFVNCTVPGDVSYTIWAHEDGSIVVDNSSTFQHLYITNMTQSNSGKYSCIAGLVNGTITEYSVDVIVEGIIGTHIICRTNNNLM